MSVSLEELEDRLNNMPTAELQKRKAILAMKAMLTKVGWAQTNKSRIVHFGIRPRFRKGDSVLHLYTDYGTEAMINEFCNQLAKYEELTTPETIKELLVLAIKALD